LIFKVYVKDILANFQYPVAYRETFYYQEVARIIFETIP